MLPLQLLVALLPGVLGASIPSDAGRAPIIAKRASSSILTFNCANMAEVCSNMCYGSFCLSNTNKLTYDAPTSATEVTRRTAAGCEPNPNRCSTKNGYTSGYNCDEYPFASVVLQSGGTPTRANRCVPSGQNSIQGGTLSSFYSGSYCDGGPCDFSIAFSNSGSVNYCSSGTAGSGSCTNDGNEVIGPNASSSKRSTPGPVLTYVLASGIHITVPEGATAGQQVWHVEAYNNSLWLEQSEAHVFDPEGDHKQYEYMHPNLYLVEDTVVGLANSSVAH